MKPARLVILGLALLAACGDDPEAGPAPAPGPEAGLIEPWDTIEYERLYGAGPVENLRLTRVEIDALGLPPGWDSLTIAAVSDLQLGLWEENVEVARAALERAAASEPDLIVLLGDYLASGADTTALARVLEPLRGRGALAVLGDRDIRSDSLEAAIKRTLERHGIQVLDRASVPLIIQGDTGYVAGLDPELADLSTGDQAWVVSQVGGTRPAILLTHNPLLAARQEGRFPVALAGGTLCGQVEVPGSARVSWLATTGFPGAAVPQAPRLFRLGTTILHTTCGTGYGFLPARFGGTPEVSLVTVHRVERGPRPEQTDTAEAAAE